MGCCVFPRLLVCDQAKQRVSIHRVTGELIQNVHIAEVETPTQISCHGNKLFVCDADNKSIVIYYFTDTELHFIARLAAPEHTNGLAGEFLECSGITTDRHGNLLIADMARDRVHLLNPRGEMSSVVARGRTLLRPMCVAVSPAEGGLMAVAQHGVFPLEEDMPMQYEVVIYKIIKADV